VWRAGQDRRLEMIRRAVPALEGARVLDDGCGLGAYVLELHRRGALAFGLDYERERVIEAQRRTGLAVFACAAAEHLPYPDASFDVVISNEVIEHVDDDQAALLEMARVLKPGGRAVIFCPNRWYPVEQHGVFWRGRYHFGNVPLVNYLPRRLRDRLAPHVRTYSWRALRRLLVLVPLQLVSHEVVFGGYDNLVQRWGRPGAGLRQVLHRAESTPLRVLGLSHLVVLERVAGGRVATIASADRPS